MALWKELVDGIWPPTDFPVPGRGDLGEQPRADRPPGGPTSYQRQAHAGRQAGAGVREALAHDVCISSSFKQWFY